MACRCRQPEGPGRGRARAALLVVGGSTEPPPPRALPGLDLDPARVRPILRWVLERGHDRLPTMAREASLEVAPHVEPLAGQHAEHPRVAGRAVAALAVVAQHAVVLG